MIAEVPGITPEVVAFADRVADIGCTAVLPHLFGEPGAEARTLNATDVISLGVRLPGVRDLGHGPDVAGHGLAAGAGPPRARALRRARAWAPSACASPAGSPWP